MALPAREKRTTSGCASAGVLEQRTQLRGAELVQRLCSAGLRRLLGGPADLGVSLDLLQPVGPGLRHDLDCCACMRAWILGVMRSTMAWASSCGMFSSRAKPSNSPSRAGFSSTPSGALNS